MATDILAADIGGTNSRFAWFSAEKDGTLQMLRSLWLNTKDHASFRQLIDNLQTSGLGLVPEKADMVVIAAAGPVEKGVYCNPPFISWDIDIAAAQRISRFRQCLLINDFVAQAYACRSPVGCNADQILPGQPAQEGTVAVIGAGTGLGKAVLIEYKAGAYLALPSEGGHAAFPFLPEENDFQRFLVKETGDAYITGNRVLSGGGLSLLHRFLTGEDLAPEAVAKRFSEDSETLAWAARFYGRACRDLALEVLALGGVYISGGIAAKTPLLVKNKYFEAEFHCSNTMETILSRIPVLLITNEESGLWGAAFYGLQSLMGRKAGPDS